MIKLLASAALLAPAVLALGAPGPEPVALDPLGASAAAVTAAPSTYKIDGGHSAVVFKVKHAGASWFYGTFEAISGSMTVDEAEPGNSSIEIEIEAGSVDSNSEQRDGHIESPDFLSAKEFPTITFKSTAIEDAGGGNLEVTGDLTFRGVTKPISAAVELIGKGEFRGERIGYEARFSFERSEFGSTYGIENNVLSDEVHMIVALEGVK